MTAHATPSDPGKTALAFLEKVRLRKVDLEPGGDTALSAQTAAEKKRQIARRLERLAGDLGSDPLEISEVKLDENFAAVLVRKIGGFDPGGMQVFAVALVKRGAEWTAAPVPASFENAGAGYAIDLRKRLELLEDWMLREQVLDLEKLREQSAGRMRRKIEAVLSVNDLRNLNSKQVGERFLAACERGDLPSMLGLLGGLAAKLPDDWPARLKAADHAVTAGSKATRPWRLLTAPEVVRAIVHHEAQDDSGLISVACLDPAGSESAPPRIEVVHFELTKGAGQLWQIDPPASFLQTTADPDDEPDDKLDSDLRDAFPAKWIETHPPAPQATAELAHQALIAALRDGNLPSILALLKLDDRPENASKACIQAAQIWWTIREPTAVRHAMPLAFRADETAAAGICQLFSARDPERLDPRVLYFEKSAAGWLWTPDPSPVTREKLQGWVDSETKRWPDQWQQTLLSDSPVLEEIAAAQAPAKDDARNCVEAWLDATRRGDVKAALLLIARLGDPRSGSAVLRNLGYEISGSRRSIENPKITGIYQGKTWTAVGVKIDREGGKPTYPLYPVVTTARGLRILVEIDLLASGSRGREFLNKVAFERLEKFSSVAAASELRTLYSEHQANVEGGKEHQPSNNSDR